MTLSPPYHAVPHTQESLVNVMQFTRFRAFEEALRIPQPWVCMLSVIALCSKGAYVINTALIFSNLLGRFRDLP